MRPPSPPCMPVERRAPRAPREWARTTRAPTPRTRVSGDDGFRQNAEPRSRIRKGRVGCARELTARDRRVDQDYQSAARQRQPILESRLYAAKSRCAGGRAACGRGPRVAECRKVGGFSRPIIGRMGRDLHERMGPQEPQGRVACGQGPGNRRRDPTHRRRPDAPAKHSAQSEDIQRDPSPDAGSAACQRHASRA